MSHEPLMTMSGREQFPHPLILPTQLLYKERAGGKRTI